MPCTIRLARVEDLPAINDIYNYYVRCSTCTYQETPDSLESRQAWFSEHGSRYPVTVAQIGNTVVGWGALSPFRPRSGYRFTVENSVYVHQDYQRQGIGGAILEDLIARAGVLGYRTIIAGIDASQKASLAIHAKYGFVERGQLREVAYKFDRWLDVVYMQLTVASSSHDDTRPYEIMSR
jgi:phosphinothricin acetyltransferase